MSITDEHGPFVYEVRGWANLIRTLEAFTRSIAHPGTALAAKASLYRTGNAEVNGINVRVTPLS
ncbi:hypothetical protein ACFYXH_02620 [Streptomyces sp. NPDC002730]|uniref:hypothetical protein n=1 Tax=Streptomyces sp. NPDC002730 TaxID=3364662 RepID=UPI00369D3EAD